MYSDILIQRNGSNLCLTPDFEWIWRSINVN